MLPFKWTLWTSQTSLEDWTESSAMPPCGMRLRQKGLERAARFTWEDTAAKTYEVLSRYENG